MKKSLVIIQDVPTQFDVPLYNLIAQESPFKLYVIYTQVITEDAEIGTLPIWDHIDAHHYAHEHLDDVDRSNSSRVAQRIIEHKPDHVIISGYWPKLHRDLLGKLTGVGTSVGLRSDNTWQHSDLSGLRGVIKKTYLRCLLPKYTFWHPVGGQAANYLTRLSRIDRPITYFPYNIDRDWFSSKSRRSRKKRSSHLAKLGFEPNTYVVLAILKWVDREDPMTLLRAFKLFQDKHKDAKLVLIGDGPLRSEVRRLIKELAVAVHAPGYQSYSSLPQWYGIANVFVHPAPDEPWGVSVNEALSSGVPVVASNGVGAAMQLLKEGFNGGLFEPRDESSLFAALEKWRATQLKADAQELNQRCYDTLNEWNYETTIESFKDALEHE